MSTKTVSAPLALQPGIYFVTGKGGVGKSFAASFLANHFSKAFKAKPKITVVRVSRDWEQSAPVDIDFGGNDHWDQQTNLQKFFDRSSRPLVGGLFSRGFKTLSGSTLFKSFVDAVPGLYEVSILGRLLYEWNKDPSQYIFVDSFSTGHFLQMLRTPAKFQSLPLAGAIKEDVGKIVDFLTSSDALRVMVAVNPEFVIMQETKELEEKLFELNPSTSVSYVANKFFTENFAYQSKKLNTLAEQSRSLSQELADHFGPKTALIIPEFPQIMQMDWDQISSGVFDETR